MTCSHQSKTTAATKMMRHPPLLRVRVLKHIFGPLRCRSNLFPWRRNRKTRRFLVGESHPRFWWTYVPLVVHLTNIWRNFQRLIRTLQNLILRWLLFTDDRRGHLFFTRGAPSQSSQLFINYMYTSKRSHHHQETRYTASPLYRPESRSLSASAYRDEGRRSWCRGSNAVRSSITASGTTVYSTLYISTSNK